MMGAVYEMPAAIAHNALGVLYYNHCVKGKAQRHHEKVVELWGKFIALKSNLPEAFVHLYWNCLKAS